MFSRHLMPVGSSLKYFRPQRATGPVSQCLRNQLGPSRYQNCFLQYRSIVSIRETQKRLRAVNRSNPLTLPLAIISPIDHNYPEPVAMKLKRGIYYSSLEPDLPKALKYFQQALAAAEDEKMNPFSEEVIGIKLRIAQLLEENQRYHASIKALELLRSDIHRFLNIYGERPDLREHRTRLLRKVVQISVKVGQLYANEMIDDLDEAEKNLTEGVETALSESQRREMENISEDAEGSWLSDEEIGGALEELGHHFERRKQYNLSSPLFLRALTLNPPPCHAAMLMNNLATSIAQTDPDSAIGTPSSKSALLSNATAWAEKAITVASAVAADQRTDECDQCCAVAAYNLGEFAEMEGLWEKARLQYSRADSVAKAAHYKEGWQRASEALKRIDRDRK